MINEIALVFILSDKIMRRGRKAVFPIIGEKIVKFLLRAPIYPAKILITKERIAELRADEFTITFVR